MATRGRKPGALSVQIDPALWTRVGRLTRGSFTAIQAALDQQADILRNEKQLPEAGDQVVDGWAIHYEIDPVRRILTLVSITAEK